MDRSENAGHRVQVDTLVVWGSWPTGSQEPALGQFPWGMAHKPPPTPPQLPYHYCATLGSCLLEGPHQAVLRGVCGARKGHQASYMNSPCYLSDPGT